MGFVDALTADQDVDVLLVDRRHQPGGHWLDAYPFARLHQPSTVYGVASRRLGDDRIDATGPNAGFYERAAAPAICDYYSRVMDEQLASSGKVSFLGLHDYRGQDADGHHVVSLATGVETTVRVRRRIVDATYVASEIPSRHRPPYVVDADAGVIPPNELVNLGAAPSGFTVIGAGKTAMDTCCWLLDMGVDPDRVRWIRPRDVWVFDRSTLQPLDLVASYMLMQARWVESAALAASGAEFARMLEAHGILLRIDPKVEPQVWRGPIVSQLELRSLRTIERVVRARVLRIGSQSLSLDSGELAAAPHEIFVDCTAAGVPARESRPVFEPGRMTLNYVIVGNASLSAAVLGTLEALPMDDQEKNRLSPTIRYSGNAGELLSLALTGIGGAAARARVRELSAWQERCRLDFAVGAQGRDRDGEIVAAMGVLKRNIGTAIARYARQTRAAATTTP